MSVRHKLPDKRDILAHGLLILLPVLSFSLLFFSDKTLYRWDITSIHYPLGVFKGRVLSSGQLPLWNPHILFGFPQLADQEVLAFHPLNVFYLSPLKPHIALSAFAVAHFALAGISSYLLARALQMSRTGAFIAAVSFSLGGYLVAQLTNMTIMTGSVWLPLILFLFIKALGTRRPVYVILCAGTIALQVMAAHPQVVFNSVFTLGCYGVFGLIRLWRDHQMAFQEKRREAALLVSVLGVAALAGLSLAAVQILPTWELKGLSPRSTGLGYAMMTFFSLAPYNLLTFLLPNILGNPVIGYTGEGVFEEFHAYAGIVPLLLVPWAWVRKVRDGHVVFFSVLAGASLLLALGHYTPLYDLLVYVPGFNFFRVPARWLFIVSFSISVLAGYGFDALRAARDRGVPRGFAAFWKILGWMNVAVSLMLVALLAFGERAVLQVNDLGSGLLSEHAFDRTLILVQGLTGQPLLQVSGDLSATLSSLNPAVLYVLISNACFLLIYLWSKRKIAAATFHTTMVSLVIVDLLFTGGTTVNPVREGSYYQSQDGAVRFLRENAGLQRILPVIQQDDLSNLMEALPAVERLYSAGGHPSDLVTDRYRVFIDAMAKSPTLVNLAGVKYLILERQPEQTEHGKVYDGHGFGIYENESVLPRVFVVHDAEVIASEQGVMARMLRDDFDPSRTVILEEEPLQQPGQTLQPADAGIEGTQITLYTPQRVVIEANLSAEGFLVLSDAHYPGWRVFVDGREERIYQADYLFRAVFLEPGKHFVEFKYSPQSLRIGLAVSLVTATALLGALVAAILIQRRR